MAGLGAPSSRPSSFDILQRGEESASAQTRVPVSIAYLGDQRLEHAVEGRKLGQPLSMLGEAANSRPTIRRLLHDLLVAPRDSALRLHHIGYGERGKEGGEVDLATHLDESGGLLGWDRGDGPDVTAGRQRVSCQRRSLGGRRSLSHVVQRAHANMRKLRAKGRGTGQLVGSVVETFAGHTWHVLRPAGNSSFALHRPTLRKSGRKESQLKSAHPPKAVVAVATHPRVPPPPPQSEHLI